MIIENFEVHNNIGVAMANHVKTLLDSFGLFDINIIKDEGSNLNILASTLILMVSCFAL